MVQALTIRYALVVLAVSAAGLVAGVRPQPVYRAQTELVRITATVHDADGRPVTNLTRTDFSVTDDEVPQSIALFTRDADTPLSIAVVLDTSRSMAGELDAVREGLKRCLEGLRAEDEVGLVAFSDRVQTPAALNSSRAQLIAALDGLGAGGGTALYRGILDGARTLSSATHRKKVILLITDGNNTAKGVSRRAAAAAAQRSEALVYALGIAHQGSETWRERLVAAFNQPRMQLLRSLTDPSGGRAELINDVNGSGRGALVKTITAFGEELRQQYTIGYYPSGNSANRKAHRVRVIVPDRPSLVVRAREIYVRP